MGMCCGCQPMNLAGRFPSRVTSNRSKFALIGVAATIPLCKPTVPWRFARRHSASEAIPSRVWTQPAR